MRIIKIVLINIAVLCTVWVAIVVGSAAWQDIRNSKSYLDRDEVVRAMLPAYSDHEEAKQIWRELKEIGRQYVPFVEWRSMAYRGRTANVDENGLRWHPGAKSGTALGMFGGSALWGMGVADSQTIPAAFDRLSQGYAITNYAEIAWNPRQSLNQLINLINAGKMPEVVLFYDGFNDIVAMCDPQRSMSLDGVIEESVMRRTLSFERPSALYQVLVKPVYDLLLHHIEAHTKHAPFTCSRDPVRAQRVAHGIVTAWQIAHELVTARGGRFHAFLQPVAFIGHPKIDYLVKNVDVKTQNFDAYKAEFEAVYPLVLKEMAGLPWAHDLTHVFDVDQPIFADTVHANGPGNEIVARTMLTHLQADQSASATP